jgi:sugar lactone lactonase YvrE
MDEVERILDVQNEAGESPHWDAEEKALYWADIVDPHLYRYYPATGKLDTIKTKIPVTGLGLRKTGGLVVASKIGLYLLDTTLKEARFISDPEADKANVRFNDGLVDCEGRYWAGSLNEVDFSVAEGTLYRLDPDGVIRTMDTGIKGSNGIGWSPDNSIMYFADTFAQVIYAYNFDPASGEISNRRIFVEVPQEAGMPDGITVDCEGFVWNGHWGGWRLTRYDPSGKIEREVRLPVQNVTSCIFGGENLDELYITTAWYLMSEEERSEQPYAGDLFRLRPGVKGLPDPKFSG